MHISQMAEANRLDHGTCRGLRSADGRTLVGTWPTESPCACSTRCSQLACLPAFLTMGCSCRTTFSHASRTACPPVKHDCENRFSAPEKGTPRSQDLTGCACSW